MCIGGNSAKTDRTTQLSNTGKLQDVAGFLTKLGGDLTGKGKTDTAAGLEDTGQASKYYSDILSGDPTKVMAAAAPEIKSITGQADQQKKEIARTGDRSGGANATTQDLGTKVREQIGDLIARQKGGAASGLERTGAQVSNVGLSETGQGIGATATGGSQYSSLIGDAIKSRELSQKIHDQAVSDWSSVVGDLIGGFM